jgi:hypothetical protein
MKEILQTMWQYALVLLLILMGNYGWGQNFNGKFSFSSATGNVSSLPYNGTTITNLSVGPLTKIGVTTSSSNNNSRANSWPTGSTDGSNAASGVIDLGKYYDFTITASAGFTISNPKLTYGVGRSGTGPRRFEWRWNIDAYGSALSVETFNQILVHTSGVLETPDANSGYTGNVIITSSSSHTTITFRFYAYAAEAESGTGGLQGDLTFEGTLVATSTTWNGTTWSNGAPNSTVDAIIDGDLTTTADVICKDLTINAGKTLTVAATHNLSVSGNAINNGSLIFKSNGSGTASFGAYTGAAIAGNNVTVERYIPAKRAWRLLTTPLQGNSVNSIYTNWQGVANEGLLLWHPSGTATPDPTNTGLFQGTQPNIWGYNAGWSAVSDTNTTNLFTPSQNNAYLVFVTGPSNSGHIVSGQAVTTLRPKGQLITGAVTTTLTANQFQLIGNPYASAISPSAMLASNSGTTLWMIDPSLGTLGGYVTYNGTDWAPVAPVASNDNIQSGQAFFVRSASTSFIINEGHKVSGSTLNWFERNSETASNDKIRVLLYKQEAGNWKLADGILAVQSPTGNDNVDAADASKISNFNENIAFRNGTSNLSIEYRGLPVAGTQQPIRLSGTTVQPYQLRLHTENYNNSNMQPYIEDIQTGTITAIPTDGSVLTVPFTGQVATSAVPDTRYRIVYQSALGTDDPNELFTGIYPNPVTEGKFTIGLKDNTSAAAYSLFNIVGQEVETGMLRAQQNEVGVGLLQQGVYLLQITQSGKTVTTKLIIK